MLRGQILIAIKTEISDSIDTAPSEVEVEQTQTINEVSSYIINELINNMYVILILLETFPLPLGSLQQERRFLPVWFCPGRHND